MSLRKKVTIFLFFPLFLTGCWDLKDIQDINFLTSIGFDYVDNQYTVYVQMLDFSTVAKMESGKPVQPIPVWVGQGKGSSAVNAVVDLYRTSQLRIFYGQINSIVVSENVMKQEGGWESINQVQHRYYEMRYMPWVFGTKEPIDKIFAVTPFFNLSPLMSLLHQPQEGYKQESFIAPLTSREFVSDFHEPGKSTLLPSISISNENWERDTTPHPMLQMDGIFVFQDGKYQGWLNRKSLIGLRWVQSQTNRSPLELNGDREHQATLFLEKPRIKIIPQVMDKEVKYAVDVKLTGYIVELLQPISESLMEEKAAEQVEKEIKSTFEKGLSIHSDLLQLEHALYRQKNKEWKRIYSGEGFNLMTDSLQKINVSVKLEHAGKLKAPSS